MGKTSSSLRIPSHDASVCAEMQLPYPSWISMKYRLCIPFVWCFLICVWNTTLGGLIHQGGKIKSGDVFIIWVNSMMETDKLLFKTKTKSRWHSVLHQIALHVGYQTLYCSMCSYRLDLSSILKRKLSTSSTRFLYINTLSISDVPEALRQSLRPWLYIKSSICK